MRKTFILTLFICFVISTYGCAKKEKPAIRIGSIEITAKEFEAALKRSSYASPPTTEGRKEFLDVFINRKIILREAERLGLAKDPEFLESVQFFWEQALLKLALNQKIKEISSPIKITEEEINEYYEAHKAEYAGKDVNENRGQISLQLFKEKQRKALDEWANSLKKNTKIKVNYKLLGLE